MPSTRNTRRRRDLLILLTVLLLVVCCVGGIVGISSFYHRASTAPDELAAAASKYLDAVQAGDLDEAYRLLCSEVHAHVTPETFRTQTKKLMAYKILGVQFVNQNGRDQGYVQTRLVLADNAVTEQTIPFRHEDQQWRPCEAS